MPHFTPPGRTEHRGNHRLFSRVSFVQGVSLLKEGDFWRQVEMPTYEELVAAEVAYVGGHLYEIDDAQAADLVLAGYGDYIDYGPTGEFYGSGIYGAGPYGGVS